MRTDQHDESRARHPALNVCASDKGEVHPRNPLITVFTIPKPFVGHTGLIQTNAIRSWRALAPHVEIVLFGDETGIAETAAELEVRHIPDIERNEHGTPLVSSAFSRVRDVNDSPVLCYCNSDVILLKDFVSAVQQIRNCETTRRFVAIGRRTELDVEEEINFDRSGAEAIVRKLAVARGRRAAIVCKEYFAYSRDQYGSIPPFAVGRGNWDNWMVASAKRSGVPVIDVSGQVTAVHQNHDYSHINGDRMECYVTGDEAKHNEKLAGGRNIISGATASWKLTEDGPRPRRYTWANFDFWFDLPRFSGLLWSLARSKQKQGQQE